MNENKLWCDLTCDEERIEFLLSGRAVETGIIAPSIVDDVIKAFRAKQAITNAVECANGRESEWGSRAEAAFEYLYPFV